MGAPGGQQEPFELGHRLFGSKDRQNKRTFQAPRRHGSARGVGGEPRAACQKEGAGRKALDLLLRERTVTMKTF
jgi:hypothetical protein